MSYSYCCGYFKETGEKGLVNGFEAERQERRNRRAEKEEDRNKDADRMGTGRRGTLLVLNGWVDVHVTFSLDVLISDTLVFGMHDSPFFI